MITPCPENQPHKPHTWYRMVPTYLNALYSEDQERADEILAEKVTSYCPGVFNVRD